MRQGQAAPRACSYPVCDPPLRGGIFIQNGVAACTGAFLGLQPQ
jgi:hypothetical protein